MATIDWQKYLKWRESKGLHEREIAIFIGLPCTVTNYTIEQDGEHLYQVQFKDRASFVCPMEFIED